MDARQPHMVKNMIKFEIRQSFDWIEQIEDWRKKPRQRKIYEKAIKNWPEDERPRERGLKRLGFPKPGWINDEKDETTKFYCHSSCS